MITITPHTLLSNIVIQEVMILPVLRRLGIRPGLAEQTVAQAAAAHNMDAPFLLFLLTGYLSAQRPVNVTLTPEQKSRLRVYLWQSHQDYLYRLLPNISIHLGLLHKSSPNSSALILVKKYLLDIKLLLEKKVNSYSDNTQTPSHPDKEEENETDLLEDLMRVMIEHTEGHYDDNLYSAVLFSLSTLHQDMVYSNYLHKLLYP